MKLNIRKKLVLISSTSIVVLFAVLAYVFIDRTQTQLTEDIYVNNLAYSNAVSQKVEDLYFLYLKQDAEVIFNKEINEILNNSPDINRLRVASFAGEIIYDSSLIVNEPLKIGSSILQRQVRSRMHSIKLKDSSDFLMVDRDSPFVFKDYLGHDRDFSVDGLSLDYLVLPLNDEVSLILDLDYSVMNERVNRIILEIFILALLGVLIAVLIASIIARKVVKPVNALVVGAQKVAGGDFDTEVKVSTNDELQFLAESFNKMASDLKVSLKAKIYQERVQHELGLASEIQKNLVPDKVCEVAGLDMSAGLIPADEIGGDIYDFVKLSKDKVMMYLGDVTGHGVPAGIVSSVANALFYGFQGDDLKDILVKVNSVLKIKTVSTMFMTLCLMSWDAAKNSFRYASAGHEQIIRYSAKTKKVSLEPSGGIALGMVDDISPHLTVMDLPLEVGDYLVIYSDGIPEAWKNEKDLYGMERFSKCVENCASLGSADDIKKAILADVETFTAGYRQMDDITIIVIKRV